jgi:TonB family protein
MPFADGRRMAKRRIAGRRIVGRATCAVGVLLLIAGPVLGSPPARAGSPGPGGSADGRANGSDPAENPAQNPAQNLSGPPPASDIPALYLDTLHIAAEPASLTGSRADYTTYADVVQTDIRRLLEQRSGTSMSVGYSIGVKLWIDPAGAVRRSEISSSTGNRARDAAICDALRQLMVSEPPPFDMPQPVGVTITTRLH